MNQVSSLKVVVAGGGVAGLEALLALRHLAGERVELTLLEPSPDFVFRPMAIAETFGRGHGERIRTSQLANHVGAKLVSGALAAVDDERRVALTDAGDELAYDALLVAPGAGSEAAFRRAITWTPEADPEVFGGLRRDIEEGYAHKVAFVVPPGTAWPLPAYELALMTAWDAKDMGQDDVEVTVVTPEQSPLGIFGANGSAAVRADLDEAGVHVRTGAYVEEAEGGFVTQPGGEPLDATRVVALPRATGPAIDGLTSDPEGFIRVDRHCHVDGTERVWAAGDAIAFPVKQGGIAAQQADAAAEAIAALAGADVDPQPFKPVLRGMLLTGRGRDWLRAEIAGGGGETVVERRALWWPPTKVAGRYLAPYLQELVEHRVAGTGDAPSGLPVDLDLEHELDAALASDA
jgi:sulfide:quinone oxidoreductase